MKLGRSLFWLKYVELSHIYWTWTLGNGWFWALDFGEQKKQYISEYRSVSKEHFTSGKEYYYAAYTIVIANLLTPLTMNYVTWETEAVASTGD